MGFTDIVACGCVVWHFTNGVVGANDTTEVIIAFTLFKTLAVDGVGNDEVDVNGSESADSEEDVVVVETTDDDEVMRLLSSVVSSGTITKGIEYV